LANQGAQKNKGGAQGPDRGRSTTDAPKTPWDKFRHNSGPIGVIVAIVVALSSFIWYVSKFDSRVDRLEEGINGKDGLKDQFKVLNTTINEKDGLKDQLRYLTTKVDLIDKQNIKDLKARGAKILKTPNVEIVRTSLLQDAKFSTPYKSSKDKTEGPVESSFLTYTVESISKDKGVIIRVQHELFNSQGQVIKSLYDQRIQIKLPPAGEPVDYGFKLVDENFESPPVHFKLVVLESFGPDNLVLATALSSTPTS
jgi:hypothetical protein